MGRGENMLCVALCAHTQCMFDADTHFMVSMLCVCESESERERVCVYE